MVFSADGSPGCGPDALSYPFQDMGVGFPQFLIEGTGSAGQMGFARDHIGSGAALEAGDAEHGRFQGIDLPADHGLEGGDEF